jgi:hypothetical protein
MTIYRDGYYPLLIILMTPKTRLFICPWFTGYSTTYISPHQYHYDEQSSWVLDKQNSRMFWVPPASKSYCRGETVVFGSRSGRVTIVDVPNVTTAQLQ